MSDFKQQAIASLRGMSLEELADYTANSSPGNWTHLAGMAEFTLRQTDWQMKAAQAQIEAAEAEKEAAHAATAAAAAESDAARAATVTASATQKNAKYMLASVIVAAFAAVASAISTYFAWYGATHPPHP
jgi:DNA-binding protein YbaB